VHRVNPHLSMLHRAKSGSTEDLRFCHCQAEAPLFPLHGRLLPPHHMRPARRLRLHADLFAPVSAASPHTPPYSVPTSPCLPPQPPFPRLRRQPNSHPRLHIDQIGVRRTVRYPALGTRRDAGPLCMPLLVLLPARSSLDCAVYVLRDAGMAGGSSERGCAVLVVRERVSSPLCICRWVDIFLYFSTASSQAIFVPMFIFFPLFIAPLRHDQKE
jgi:hypothetical protein